MPRLTLPPATPPIRTIDAVGAIAERLAKNLSLVVGRDLRFSAGAFSAVVPPFEVPANTHAGFEFRVDGAARGGAFVVLALRDAATLCDILSSESFARIEERRKAPALGADCDDPLRELGDLLRGAVEQALGDIAPDASMRVASIGAGEMAALVGGRGAAWPRCLSARGTFEISGLEPGPAEILIELPVAKALDPALDLDTANGAAGEPVPPAADAAPGPELPAVIVFEPDEFYRKLIASALGSTGRIEAASSIPKLRGLLAARPEATLLVDIAEDDEEILCEVEALRKSSAPPVVLATLATAKRSIVLRLAQAGVKHIQKKPYSRAAITARLESLLRG